MKIYYTGAISYNSAQTDHDKSLGGFKSSTEVPNGLVNNIFGDVSYYALDEKFKETRAIILYNESGSAITNLYFNFNKYTGALGTYEVSAIALTPVSGQVSMEKIQNTKASPYQASFTEANGNANKVLLAASMTSGAYIGLWIRRTLTAADKAQFDSQTMIDNFNSNVELVVDGKVDIELSWT